jgi:glutathione synthase/RimK-type ligase-like ATP-grasp enzyme
MKKVLVIGRENAGEKNDGKALASGLAKNTPSGSFTGIYYEDLLIYLSNEEQFVKALIKDSWQDITEYNHIILINWSHDKLYSDLAHLVAEYADNNSIKVWNSELINARSMTKISQLSLAASINVPIPSTIFSFSKQHLFSSYSHNLSFPIIVKDPTASRGRRNYLITNEAQLQELLQKPFPIVLQEYIKNDSSDLRIIMGGEDPVFAFKRSGKDGTHLNNISAGGSAEKININELDQKIVNYAKKLANKFKKEMCGIDFMYDKVKHQFVFLEINTTPQLVNGIFADDKLKALGQVLG